MNPSKILLTTAILLTLVFSLTSVSAYSHSFFEVSDKYSFNEDISGEDRGFTLKRSTDIPRNTCGYYDWSAHPRICDPRYSHERTRIPDNLALEAFNTFQADSQAQNNLELLKEQRRNYFSFYGYGYPRYFGGYGYGGYGRSYDGFYRY